MKLFSRLLLLFVEVLVENDKFGYLNPILGTLGVTDDIGWKLVGKPMVNFLFALIDSIRINWTFFRSVLQFRNYEAKYVQIGCFRWVDLFALKFYLDRVVPINHSCLQKTRRQATRPWRPPFFCVPSFWRNTGVWRTDGYDVAYTVLVKLATCNKTRHHKMHTVIV